MAYNIIIIEDVAMHSAGIVDFVKQSGNKIVREYINSQNFFKEYKKLENEIDVVLVDINLANSQSELNGFEIVQRLAREQYNPKFAIVTDRETFESIKDAKSNGADGFVGKTATSEEFGQFLKKIINLDDFIVAYPTMNKTFNYLLDKNISKLSKLGLTKKHKEIIINIYKGKKTNEIVESFLQQELNEKILTYKGTFAIKPNEILKYIKNNNLPCFDKAKTIVEKTTIDTNTKLKNIFAIKECQKHLEKNIKTYNKLKDNLLTQFKLEIKEKLSLPDIKRETIIAGAIFRGIIFETDIF